MALPTLAQWGAAVTKIDNMKGLGSLYLPEAHIFRAFGMPISVEGQFKVKWTSGSTTAYIAATAGAPATGVAPPQVTFEATKYIAGIGSQAYTDIASEIMGGDYAEQLSVNQAVDDIHLGFVAGAVASDTGESGMTLWGAGDFFSQTAVVNAGQIITGSGSYSNTEGLNAIDAATIRLPRSGYNICLCSDGAYNHVKSLLRNPSVAGGGMTIEYTSRKDYGFAALTYDDTLYFNTKAISDSTSVHGQAVSDMYFFNISPAGTQLVMSKKMWEVLKGRTVGQYSRVWDIALLCQLSYNSPKACAKITNFRRT